MIVYKITNLVNGKIYIGQTRKTAERRWTKHVNAALTGRSKSVLHKAIRKYGKDSFSVEVLLVCSSETELNNSEVYFIRDTNSTVPNGYNLNYGGYAGVPTLEARKNMSLAHIGIKDSKQTRLRKSKASKGKMKSKTHAENISKGRMGMKFSKTHIENLRLSHLGKTKAT